MRPGATDVARARCTCRLASAPSTQASTSGSRMVCTSERPSRTGLAEMFCITAFDQLTWPWRIDRDYRLLHAVEQRLSSRRCFERVEALFEPAGGGVKGMGDLGDLIEDPSSTRAESSPAAIRWAKATMRAMRCATLCAMTAASMVADRRDSSDAKRMSRRSRWSLPRNFLSGYLPCGVTMRPFRRTAMKARSVRVPHGRRRHGS